MGSLSSVLKQRRKELGLTLAQIADAMGVAEATVQRWESGNIKSVRQEKIGRLAEILRVSPITLMGWDAEWAEQQNLANSSNSEILTPDGRHITLQSPTITEDTETFPVIGDIAAGYDSIALEEWCGDTIEIPKSYLRGRDRSDFIVLTVKGNSMYPMYLDGDKVLILKQPIADTNGGVCAVIYDSEISTLKKVILHQEDESVELVPINPEYMPKIISGFDLENFKIIGVPKLLIREIEQF